MTSPILALLVCFLAYQVLAWEALPSIPSGRRSQFLVLRDDGAYKFGYDTGNGNAAKQEGDPSNEVQGHYFYKNSAGQDIDLKYTSGVQGFQPEGLEKIQALIKSSAPSGPSNGYVPQSYNSPGDDNSGAYTPDDSGAYNSDDSGAYSPDNSGDSGAYSPDNSGDSGAYSPDNSGDSGAYSPDNSGDYKGDQEPSGDASYNFNVDTSSYKRTETSDAGGNIQGSYSFSNKEGTHDLQYEAGAGKGFIARSGSLSKPNGIGGRGGGFERSGGYQAPTSYDDGSYRGDDDGSYRGDDGGSYRSDAAPKGPINSDGSYKFGFSTSDQSREESGDTTGNVRGRFYFRNSGGSHDLSYQAGSETGFLVTGGSLAKPNGLPNGAGPNAGPSGPTSYLAPSSPSFRSSSGGSADGSYSFGFSAGDQDRQEDSDASGNVRGRFSYKNSAGTHDLSYVAGSSTGFLPTGGSLANPNGLKGGSAPLGRSSSPAYSPSDEYSGGESQDDQADSGDSSYNFNFDTGDYQRKESSDARGNVRGSYSFRNSAGNHDLSFEAGSGTGFKPVGGSLTPAPGLSEAQLRSGFRGSSGSSSSSFRSSSAPEPYSAPSGPLPQTPATSYSLGNVKVHSYLPPSNEKHKFGYIFDTNY